MSMKVPYGNRELICNGFKPGFSMEGKQGRVFAVGDRGFRTSLLEGMNSIIQNIKRRARGFKNLEYFKTMIYLTCGKLPLEKYLPSGLTR